MTDTKKNTLAPGSWIGILGSGQLGRMTAEAAKRLGYKTAVLSETAHSPAGQVCDREVLGSTADPKTLKQFAASVDRLTLEFENISAEAAHAAEESSLLCPAAHILHTSQNRLREKTYLAKVGVKTTGWREVHSLSDLKTGVSELGLPCVLKTADFGYDGKGQFKVVSLGDVDSIPFPGAYILEKWVPFTKELSILGARSLSGEVRCFPVFENTHTNHILDYTVCPAAISETTAKDAEKIVTTLLESLAYVGVLCVELFLTSNGELLVNELAPRPHNSGHLTIEAFATSQFEQHVRAVADLELGETLTTKPAAMVNLLGDLWKNGDPNWSALAAFADVKLHLYGKKEARPGRKMGHLTVLADSTKMALTTVQQARSALTRV